MITIAKILFFSVSYPIPKTIPIHEKFPFPSDDTETPPDITAGPIRRRSVRFRSAATDLLGTKTFGSPPRSDTEGPKQRSETSPFRGQAPGAA